MTYIFFKVSAIMRYQLPLSRLYLAPLPVPCTLHCAVTRCLPHCSLPGLLSVRAKLCRVWSPALSILTHHKEIILITILMTLEALWEVRKVLVKVQDTQVTFKWREIAKMLRNSVTTTSTMQHRPQRSQSALHTHCWTDVVITSDLLRFPVVKTWPS